MQVRKEWLLWLWVCIYTELKQTVLNSWYVKAMGVRRDVKTGANPGGAIEAIAPPKTKAITPHKSIVLSQKCCEVYCILK